MRLNVCCFDVSVSKLFLIVLHCFEGSGTSKKLAKRNAAAKMLSRIHDVPVDMRSSHEAEAEEDTFNTVRRALFSDGDYAVVSISVWFQEFAFFQQQMGGRLEGGKSKGLGCTWDSLRNSAGEKILQLRCRPLGQPDTNDSNFCSLLNELSEEQRFDVSYLDIGEIQGCLRCFNEILKPLTTLLM